MSVSTPLVTRVLLNAGASLAAMNMAGSAAAQSTPSQPDAAPNARTSMQAQHAAQDEIVVTAQLREQSVLSVPISIQAISGATLEKAEIQNIRDLGSLSPSIAVQQSNSASAISFSIRGVSSRTVGSSFVQPSAAIIIDGVPAARQAEANGELDDVERVEVLNGPQGTLFGKSATAGVLQIVNRRPQREWSAKASATYTTQDELALGTILNGGGGDTWFRINAHYGNMKPLFDNINPNAKDFGAARNYSVSAKVLHDFGSDVSWLVAGSYSRSKSTLGNFIPVRYVNPAAAATVQYASVVGYTPSAGNTFINSNTPGRDSLRLWGMTSELRWRLGDRLSLTALTGYREVLADDDIDVDFGPCGAKVGEVSTRNLCPTTAANPTRNYVTWPLSANRRANDTRYASQEIRLNYADDHFDAVLGMFGQTLKNAGFTGTAFVSGTGTTLTSYSPLDFNSRDRTGAVYGDVTYKLVPTLSVFGGLRYTIEKQHINYTRFNCANLSINLDSGVVNGGAPCPIAAPIVVGTISSGNAQFSASNRDHSLGFRAGLQWQPSGSQNYYISYARANKGPAADTGATAGDAAPFLLHETGTTLEVGAKRRFWNGRVNLSIAAYTGKITDIQVSTIIPSSATQTRFLNAGDLKLRGVEFEARARLDDHLAVNTGVAYLDARFDGGSDGCLIGASFFDITQQVVGVAPCTLPGSQQTLTGSHPFGSTPWRVTAAATYDRELSFIPYDLSARVGYVWTDTRAGAINRDPRSRVPAIGLLDASIALKTRDDRWELKVFGRNLANKFNPSIFTTTSGIISQVLTKDYERSVGVQLTARY